MKALVFIICAALMCGNSFAERQKDIKDLRKSSYPSHMQTLNISATSDFSYEGAMNRLARMKPDGYIIESLQYLRVRGKYTVLAKLRKVGS